MFLLIGLLFIALGNHAPTCTGLRLPSLSWQEVDPAYKPVVRLVKKTWKPRGVTFDDAVDEFPDSVSIAYDIIWNDRNRVDFLEQPFEIAHLLFTMTSEEGGVEFDSKLESIIIVNPLVPNDEVGFVNNIVTALGMRNIHKKYNIFTIEPQALNLSSMMTMFQQAISGPIDYEQLAHTLSHVIVRAVVKDLWAPERIHLIGHGQPAALIGHMARYINYLFDKKIASLMCLNPPNSVDKDVMHVTRDDAKVVHILHSSAYTAGSKSSSGTAEFVLNDGYVQPECDSGLVWRGTAEALSCSQLQGIQMFLYVILYPTKFQARKCDSWPRFQSCLCETNDEASITYPIGLNAADGLYYLQTTPGRPYGKGEEGSKCESWAKTEFEKKKKEEYNRVMDSLYVN